MSFRGVIAEVMNLEKLSNNYRDLVIQFDLLNTINGGSISISPKLVELKGKCILTVKTPSISTDNINLVIDGDKFILFTWVTNRNEKTKNIYPKTPCYVNTISVPPNIDVNNIFAYYKNEELRVYLPLVDGLENSTRKKIRINSL